MIIHDIEQRSEEWHKLRNRMPTSSEMHMLITAKKKQLSTQSKSLVLRKIAQRESGEYDDPAMSYAMQRGIELEPIAREVYKQNFAPEIDVREVGFVSNRMELGEIGASTDGFVGEDGILEIKCLTNENHMKILLASDPAEDYWLQLQTELFVTDRKWCDLFFYHPNMPSRRYRVFPDVGLVEIIMEAINAFHEEMTRQEAQWELIKQAHKNDIIQPMEILVA